MLLKSLIKNPILVVGMLMMAIVLFDLSRRGILPLISERVIATSCKSARVMLDKRVPSTWTIQCENNNMAITIHSQLPQATNPQLTRNLYRELANKLKFIAQNALNESLERTLLVRVLIIHPQMEINAVTEGKDLAKLATLNEPKFVAEHLKTTVQVQGKHNKTPQ